MDGSPSQGRLTLLHHASWSHLLPDHLATTSLIELLGIFLVLQIYPMFGETHSPQLNVGSELFALQKDF